MLAPIDMESKLTIQQRQVVHLLRAGAALNFSHKGDETFHVGYGDPGTARQLQDGRELRVTLGLAVMNGNITPHAAVCLRRAAVEGHHGVKRGVDRRAVSVRSERRGIVAVEA